MAKFTYQVERVSAWTIEVEADTLDEAQEMFDEMVVVDFGDPDREHLNIIEPTEADDNCDHIYESHCPKCGIEGETNE